MKLTYAQLESHLTKQLSPIYILSGDELFLKQEATQWIRKAAKKSGFDERIRITPEAGYDWDQLYSLLYSNSLLAEKRLIELDYRDITPNKTASKILQDYAANPSPDNILLIDLSKIDDKISKSAWYKALEKVSATVPIWPLPREQLPQWIMNRAQKYKLTLRSDAANLLADYVEGNLVAAAQAIEKIFLLKPEKMIDAQLIEIILTDESRFTVFDFIEHLVAGNQSRALHILQHLEAEGEEPILILWAITRELRLLAELTQSMKQGASFDTLFQKHRIFFKRQSAVRQFLTKHTLEDCWKKLCMAAEIDKVLKGATPGNAWEQLQLFCLK